MWGLLRVVDRLLGLVKLDHASRSTRRFFREYENRTRYPNLTRDILESMDELDFDSAVVDHVNITVAGDYDRAFGIVSRMSPGIQAVYSTWWVQAELDNGGFHQYFRNWGAEWPFMALEGYRLLGAHKHAALMARAIEIHLDEESEQQRFYSGRLSSAVEEYLAARKASRLPELDALFDNVDDEYVIGLAFDYMQAHMDEFITVGPAERDHCNGHSA